jgi:hypothetical protein
VSCGSPDFDMITEVSDAAYESGCGFGRVAAGEVFGPEVLVVSAVTQHVVDSRQNRRGHRDGRLFGTAACFETQELSLQIAILLARRAVQFLAWGVVAALLVVCGIWAVIWFAKSPPSPDAVQSASESKPVTITTIHLNSDPQGADATTSLGWSCRTPCSIEVSADGSFTVTFTRPGFAPSTIAVQVESAQPGALDAKFTPDPVFAALQPLRRPKAKVTVPAGTTASRAPPPRDVHEGQSWWCRLFGCS